MPKSSFFSNTGFRFALLHTLIFVISVSAIAWVAEITVTSALQHQARDRVEAESQSMRAEYRRHGLDGLRSAIEERLSAVKRRLQYAIVGSNNTVLVGDRALADFSSSPDILPKIVFHRQKDDARDSIMLSSTVLAPDLTLLVADNLESVEDVEDVVLNGYLISISLALVLGLAGGVAFTKSLLKRVDNITRTADAIIGGDLTQRVARTGSGDDFDRLSTTLNAMLDRIAALLDNLRQVSTDIAHDMRTPLSHLRQNLETARTHAASIEEYDRAIDRAIDDADSLLETFAALLRIAQVESKERRKAFRAVDLSEVIRTVGEAYSPAFEESGRSLSIGVNRNLFTIGDRGLLAQLFANLLENALRHTPVGTTVAITATRRDPFVSVEVADNGPGIPGSERDKVFRRFYRLESSRTSPGNGLGLSLVAAVTDLHGATVALSDNHPGLVVTIAFTASADRLAKQAGKTA